MTTRIYYPNIELSDLLLLESSGAHHLISVLRRKIGDSVILFDGKNNEYHTIIEKMDKKRLWLTVRKKITINRESPLSIHLIQGVSKGDRMDWVVQKAVELGVSHITPILTQHGSVKLDSDRMLKKVEHWQNIAISACEQCGRNIVPVIDKISHFSEILNLDSEEKKDRIRWILHPDTLPPLQSPLSHSPLCKGGLGGISHQNNITKAQLLIGPEGGFSDNEILQAITAKFQAVTLGPRILRTETAAIAAISALQTYFGDWFI